MFCSICGTEIESIDQAVDDGWIPYFYDGETEHDVACPSCSETVLQVGEDGEMEVKPKYQGKIVCADTEKDGHHLVMGIAVHYDVSNN